MSTVNLSKEVKTTTEYSRSYNCLPQDTSKAISGGNKNLCRTRKFVMRCGTSTMDESSIRKFPWGISKEESPLIISEVIL